MDSSTFCAPPPPLRLHRAWPRRLWADIGLWWQRRRLRAAAPFAGLPHLDERALRDIGVPGREPGGVSVADRRMHERMRW